MLHLPARIREGAASKQRSRCVCCSQEAHASGACRQHATHMVRNRAQQVCRETSKTSKQGIGFDQFGFDQLCVPTT